MIRNKAATDRWQMLFKEERKNCEFPLILLQGWVCVCIYKYPCVCVCVWMDILNFIMTVVTTAESHS